MLPETPAAMLAGLIARGESARGRGDDALWADEDSRRRHLIKRLRDADVTSAQEYDQRTREVLAGAPFITVVTPTDQAMRKTGKMAIMNSNWVVLLSETGGIVTSYPLKDGYVGFEARHKQNGDQVHEYPIPHDIRARLVSLFR